MELDFIFYYNKTDRSLDVKPAGICRIPSRVCMCFVWLLLFFITAVVDKDGTWSLTLFFNRLGIITLYRVIYKEANEIELHAKIH